MQKINGQLTFNGKHYHYPPRSQRSDCDDWLSCADKRSIQEDWPSFRQVVKECNEWIDSNNRRTIDRFREFNDLVEVWRRETGMMSSLEEKFLHPAYLRIIGMGKDAIPLILEEMKQRPGHWFCALKAITGENPMRPEHAGNIKRMTEDWLFWGERNGHIWIKR